jgi:hypothetical protein
MPDQALKPTSTTTTSGTTVQPSGATQSQIQAAYRLASRRFVWSRRCTSTRTEALLKAACADRPDRREPK